MAFETATAGDHVELLKRLREILLGLPALFLWHRAAAKAVVVPLA